MFYILYYLSGIILIPGIILSVICQVRVNSTFKKYKKVNAKSGWVAREMSEMLLEKYDCEHVVVQPIGGNLTDNYNPKDQTLNLSQDVYNSSSIASLGVSAHEVGHAIQDANNYKPLKFRAFMVPVVNIGSYLALPLAVIGAILTWISSLSQFGEFLLLLGIIAYSLTAFFALITLPVEINASNRAKKMLAETGVLDEKELKGASKVLNAAAWTYVASLAISLLYLLRFIIIISSLKRND